MSEFSKRVAVSVIKKVSPANLLKLAGGPLGLVHMIVSFPLGYLLILSGERPEHWKSAQVKGFDQAYRNFASLIDFETSAALEAGWTLTSTSGGAGPNILFMGISITLLTLVCFSAIALVALM